jgi:hypothetical protein
MPPTAAALVGALCRRGANVLSDVRNLGTGNVRENQIVLMEPSEKLAESGLRRPRLQARREGGNR